MKERGHELKVTSDGFFYEAFDPKGDPNSPQIGDVRISFQAVKPQDITVAAAQTKGTFSPWSAPNQTLVDLLKPGIFTKDALFAAAQGENVTMTWILRLGGFLLMAVGIYLVFKPLVVLADVLPFFGNLLSMGIGLFAGGIALVLSLLTIAIAWVFYRPLVGVGLLVAGVVVLAGLVALSRGKKKLPAQKE